MSSNSITKTKPTTLRVPTGKAGGDKGDDNVGVIPAGAAGRVFVVMLCLLWLIPTIGLLVESFRPQQATQTSGWWTALASPLDQATWTVSNYTSVLFSQGMANAFLNSFVVTLPATVLPIVMATFAAYGFAWKEFKGKETLFVVLIGLLVIPLQVAFIPLLRLYSTIGIAGTFASVWLTHAMFAMPLSIYILRNFIAGLPRELIEATRVDGATDFQTFWKIVIPLSVPAIASFAIFQFLWVWNDLLVALVFLGGTPDVQVVTVALAGLIGTRGQDFHILTAAAFVTMSVPIIVFFSLQRYFVRGLTSGSVRG